MEINEMLRQILTEIQGLNKRVDSVEKDLNKRMDIFERRLVELKTEVERNNIIAEHTVQKCIEVLGEGYQATTERVQSIPIETMKAQINRAQLTAEFAHDKIEKLKQQINQTA